jgi:hypothetical protein
MFDASSAIGIEELVGRDHGGVRDDAVEGTHYVARTIDLSMRVRQRSRAASSTSTTGDAEPRPGGRLGNPRAHEAAADDGGRLDVDLAYVSSEFQKPFRSQGRQQRP